MSEKKEAAKSGSDRGIYQAAQIAGAKTLKLKVAGVFEEQKEGLQGQGTVSERNSSS